MRVPVLAVVLVGVLLAHAEEQKLIHLAITELNGEGVDASSVRVISDRLRTELFRTGVFTVVERGQMEDILREQGFQQAGCTSDACVVEVGQILGVEQIVAGSVGKLGELFTLNMRLIDVGSAKITHTVNVDCRCTVEDVLTKSTVDIARQLAAAVTGQEAPPLLSGDATETERGRRALRRGADGGKERRAWPKWLFGSLAVVSGGCGVLMDALVGDEVEEMERIEQDYHTYVAESGVDDRYEEFANDYAERYQAAEENALIRNILYGTAGACAIAFGVSFFF